MTRRVIKNVLFLGEKEEAEVLLAGGLFRGELLLARRPQQPRGCRRGFCRAGQWPAPHQEGPCSSQRKLQFPRYQCSGSMTFWCGSMPLTNGSESGFGSRSCYFRHWPSRRQQILLILLFEGIFTSFFNDKKYKRSHKTVGIKILDLDPDPYLWLSVADPDPNPDPHVFGPPGSGSGSTSQRYGSGSCSGSGSFYNHAKIVRKTLIPTILWLFLNFVFE